MKAEEMYSGAQRRRLASFKFPLYSGQRPGCLSERGLHCPILCPHTHRDSESGHLPAPPRPQGWLRVCFAPRMRGHGGRKKCAPSQQGSEGEDARLRVLPYCSEQPASDPSCSFSREPRLQVSIREFPGETSG